MARSASLRSIALASGITVLLGALLLPFATPASADIRYLYDELGRALGAGLHAVQDAWAHDLRHPYPGTLAEHLPGERPDRQTPWVSPDSLEDNPWEWSMSARATEEYIKDFVRGRGQKPTCD